MHHDMPHLLHGVIAVDKHGRMVVEQSNAALIEFFVDMRQIIVKHSPPRHEVPSEMTAEDHGGVDA